SSVVERSLGKTEVMGPIPIGGSVGARRRVVRGYFSRVSTRHRCDAVRHRTRRGSSAGQSARLIIVRSRVRAPPPLPRTTFVTHVGRRRAHTVGNAPPAGARGGKTVASKSQDVRPKITLAC